jgi:hypothetical protein
MSWVVIHEQTGQQVGEHKTKKKATEQASEMQAAHEKIEARHNGEPITFRVEKRVDQEPVAEEAPVEEE